MNFKKVGWSRKAPRGKKKLFLFLFIYLYLISFFFSCEKECGEKFVGRISCN